MVVNIAFGIIMAAFILVILTSPKALQVGSFFNKLDDTDDFKAKERSGLILYIDHGTGCHYLKSGAFDALTPRLDKNGKIVCEYQRSEIREINKSD